MRKISLLALLAAFSLSAGVFAGEDAPTVPPAAVKHEAGEKDKHEEKVVKKAKAKAKKTTETENAPKNPEEAPKN